MYNFHHTWPYEKMMGEIYLNECPFCHESSVHIHMKKDDFEKAFEEVKTHVVMPCCHEKLVILKMDDDYIWSDRPLR
ncbi:hypothetical protein JOD45_002306 [Scopulibacillus daqui]|uniref:Uncharacterized protein n=1 Tax=Scopulibacillus daqui TaxID=1469162 RepID=A0ABS2Q1A4_9BACL|nr:hypothetical protein [Scopulibacillus daqui]MBM7646081.1 hypothetical protein [Scopulibacillus daqui]